MHYQLKRNGILFLNIIKFMKQEEVKLIDLKLLIIKFKNYVLILIIF